MSRARRPGGPRRLAVAALLAAWACVPTLAAPRGGAGNESWILVFEEGRGGPAALSALESRGVRGGRSLRVAPRLVLLRGLPEPAARALSDLPGLQAIEPDARVELLLEESVPQVRADSASLAAAGLGGLDGSGVRICVVDSGVRASHEALAGRVDLAAGANTAGGLGIDDVEGHGTHVASIAAGAWPSGRRGVAPGATLVPVRACGADRSCAVSAVLLGIDHCADPQGGAADVLNLSLGGSAFTGTCDSNSLAIAANAAVDAGLVVVAASGNDGHDDRVDAPACASGVIAVGAVYDLDLFTSCGGPLSFVDERACFSNGGPVLDLVAPGAVITAADDTHDESLAAAQGTSMAAPHVSGLAALLRQRAPDASPAEVRAALTSSALDLGPPGFDPAYGHGRVDAVRALQAIEPCPDCPPPAWGDVHPEEGDGDVDLADWLALRRAAAQAGAPAARVLRLGDLSPATIACLSPVPPSHWCPVGDGELGLDDVTASRRVLAGVQVPSCEPCEEAAPSIESGEPGALRRPGDVAPAEGGDDRLDVADVLRVLRFAVGLEDPGAEELLRADASPAGDDDGVLAVQGDGRLDVADVLLVLRASVGLAQLGWPRRELVVTSSHAGGVAAVHLSLAGWPAWAVPGGAGAGCGLGGGLDAVGDDWRVTCAFDPAALGSGAVLARPWYRGPEPVPPASLATAGEGVDSALDPVALALALTAP